MTFPDISPFLFEYNGFGIRWYALAYIVGLLLAWRTAMMLTARPHLWANDTPPYKPEQAENLLFMLTLGVILGGRLGFVLFYNFDYYMANPLQILKTWEGGMAFHGGLLGVVIGGLIFCRVTPSPVLSTADSIAVGVPFGLLFGRVANFINGELWGKPGDVPWAMRFPIPDPRTGERDWTNLTEPRHPSQLYEAFLEGIVIFIVLRFLTIKFKALTKPGICAGMFILLYGFFRFCVEFVREPDATMFGPLTRGMTYSLPMVLIGLLIVLWAWKRPPVSPKRIDNAPKPDVAA